MTCPDCERHKLSAALWRHKAYELHGTPLPWSAEEVIKEAVAAEREACAKLCDEFSEHCWAKDGAVESVIYEECAAAIRARGEKK